MTDATQDALTRHSDLLSDQSKAMSDMAELIRDMNRKLIATQRLTMSLAALVAQRSPDPLAVTEGLRRSALDSLPLPDDGSFDGMREPLERMLATIEAVLTKPK